MRLLLLLLLLLLLSTLSCSQGTNTKYETDDFSVSYPVDYEFQKAPQKGVDFIIIAKKNNEDSFAENINLVKRNIPNTSFNDFANISEKEIQDFGKIIESKRFKVNDKDCLRVVFTATQQNIELTVIQHYYLDSKKAYVLTFTSETEDYEKYYKEMNSIMRNFKIK
ncbi:hypothetical protein [Mariniflexile rhizosphaerae]|uniref:hypothetical protein n=1 Tax=unclassified Mariniflexile TaxID=2643887 RepID=UPI000CBD253C|nr:MAG: putative lipoprotein [Flavobacteriaceae bacterium FS1-H7996/R]